MRGANRFMFQKMCKYVESIEWYVMSVCARYFVDGGKLAVFLSVCRMFLLFGLQHSVKGD